MTLGTYMERSTGNVKLGTGGGGYLYCGELKDLDLDALDIENVLAKVTRICNCRRIIKDAEGKLESPKTRYIEYRANQIRNQKEPLEYDAWIKKLQKIIKKHNKDIKSAAGKLVNYKHVIDREITDRYLSIAERDTTIIIIEGDEIGKAWTTDEYEKMERSNDASIKGK